MRIPLYAWRQTLRRLGRKTAFRLKSAATYRGAVESLETRMMLSASTSFDTTLSLPPPPVLITPPELVLPSPPPSPPLLIAPPELIVPTAPNGPLPTPTGNTVETTLPVTLSPSDEPNPPPAQETPAAPILPALGGLLATAMAHVNLASTIDLSGGACSAGFDSTGHLDVMQDATPTSSDVVTMPAQSTVLFQGRDNIDDQLSLDLGTLPRLADGSSAIKTIVYNGGAGGYDTLVLKGGSFQSGSYIATGPDSGILTHDDVTIIFTGLEPVIDVTSTYAYSIYATSNADTINVVNGVSQDDGYYDEDNNWVYLNTIQTLRIYEASSHFEEITVGNKGYIEVYGQGGNDTINLQYTQQVTALSNLMVDGGSGDDVINASTVQSCASSLTLRGSAGDDTFIVSRAAGADFGVTIDGGTHSTVGDTLNFNDQAASSACSYTLTSTAINDFQYTNIQTLTVNGGTSSNTFDVTSNVAGTSLNLNGGNANDTFNIGGTGNGSLNNVAGTITIDGKAGTDTVNVNDQSATVGYQYGITNSYVAHGSTVAIYYSAVENLTLNASAGLDTIAMTSTAAGTAVTLNGGNGNDNFYLYGGNATLAGGAGDDLYAFNDYYAGSTPLGHDTIIENSGQGTDTVAFWWVNSGATLNLALTSEQEVMSGHLWLTVKNSTGGVASMETICGSDYVDTLTANDLGDTLWGRGGNDTLVGGTGNDVLLGGGGNDVYHGGAGNDYLYLGEGNNTAYGDAGTDVLFDSNGTNYLDGGSGDDIYIFWATGTAHDTVDEQAGGGTADYLSFIYENTGVTVDLAASGDQTVIDGRLTLNLVSPENLEYLEGSNYDDVLYGNAQDNNIGGRQGNDVIDGRAGNDTISGDDGNDRLTGGTGSDWLYGNAGSDTFVFDPAVGNLGWDGIVEAENADSDTLDFSAFTAGITVDLSSNNTSQPVVPDVLTIYLSCASGTSLENVIGGAGADAITGNSRDNRLDGRAGNDSLTGGSGDDFLIGGAGSNTLDGGTGNDTLDPHGNGTTAPQFDYTGDPYHAVAPGQSAGALEFTVYSADTVQPVIFAAAGVSPAGSMLAYSIEDFSAASSIPAPPIDGATGVVFWRPPPAPQVANSTVNYSFTVVATDPSGARTEQNVVVHVKDYDDPPTLTAFPDAHIWGGVLPGNNGGNISFDLKLYDRDTTYSGLTWSVSGLTYATLTNQYSDGQGDNYVTFLWHPLAGDPDFTPGRHLATVHVSGSGDLSLDYPVLFVFGEDSGGVITAAAGSADRTMYLEYNSDNQNYSPQDLLLPPEPDGNVGYDYHYGTGGLHGTYGTDWGIVVDSGPSHGTIDLTQGTLGYRPDQGFAGVDSLQYHLWAKGTNNTVIGNVATRTLIVGKPFYAINDVQIQTGPDSQPTNATCSCQCNNEPKPDVDHATGGNTTTQNVPGGKLNAAPTPAKPMVAVTMTADPNFTSQGFEAQILINNQVVSHFAFEDDWVKEGDQVQIFFPFDVGSDLASGQYNYEIRLVPNDLPNFYDPRVVRPSTQPITVRQNNDFGLGEGWRLEGLDRLLFAWDAVNGHLAAGVSEIKWLSGNGLDYTFSAAAAQTTDGATATDDLTGSRLFLGNGTADSVVTSFVPIFILRDKYGTRSLYDELGRLRWQVDRNDNITQFTYDTTHPLAIVSIVSLADNRGTSFQYGADGRISGIVDFAGRQTSLTYTDSRLAFIIQPNPAGGNSGGPTTEIRYDDQGRISLVSGPAGFWNKYDWDNNGNGVKITYSDDTVGNDSDNPTEYLLISSVPPRQQYLFHQVNNGSQSWTTGDVSAILIQRQNIDLTQSSISYVIRRAPGSTSMPTAMSLSSWPIHWATSPGSPTP